METLILSHFCCAGKNYCREPRLMVWQSSSRLTAKINFKIWQCFLLYTHMYRDTIPYSQFRKKNATAAQHKSAMHFLLTLSCGSHLSYIHTWQWGCGLEQPITFPLFSNIWTHLYLSPSSRTCSVQAVITLKISASSISGRVRSECGWKHMTRQVPWAGPTVSSLCSDWPNKWRDTGIVVILRNRGGVVSVHMLLWRGWFFFLISPFISCNIINDEHTKYARDTLPVILTWTWMFSLGFFITVSFSIEP